MALVATSAFYGEGKNLRAGSIWPAIGSDIKRRLEGGDLSSTLRFLSFAKRSMATEEAWLVLLDVFDYLDFCGTLELTCCNLRNVAHLIDALPRLAPKVKCWNLQGNNLSGRNVRMLSDAMAAA